MKGQANAGLELDALGDELVMVIAQTGRNGQPPAKRKGPAAAAQVMRAVTGKLAVGGGIVAVTAGDADGEELGDGGALEISAHAQVVLAAITSD